MNRKVLLALVVVAGIGLATLLSWHSGQVPTHEDQNARFAQAQQLLKLQIDKDTAANIGMSLTEFRSLDKLDQEAYADCTLIDKTNPNGPLEFIPLLEFSTTNDEHVERIAHLPRIETVFLLSAFGDKGIRSLREVTWIRRLAISRCSNASDHEVRELLKCLPSLQFLQLDPVYLGRDITPFMAPTEETLKVIGGLRELREVSLSGVQCPHGGMQYLSKLPKLNSLSLFSEELDAEGLSYLEKLPQLRSLSLGRIPNAIDEHPDDRLVAVSELSELERLTLATQTTKSSIEQVSQLVNLTELEIIQPESMLLPANDYEPLSRLRNLRILRIRWGFSVDAVKHLERLPNLVQVELGNDIELPKSLNDQLIANRRKQSK